jgi:putative two-component system response regulator
MKDEEKSRAQLIEELITLRRLLAGLRASADHDWQRQQKPCQSRRQLPEVMLRVAEILAGRNLYLVDHQRRVAQLSCAIAQEMGLSEDQIGGLNTAAMMHDIGKILVPLEILNNPAPLSPQEWTLIQAHSQGGYNILKNLDFSWPVAQIVLQHHERMDGSGYPAGLTGEDILLEARILAVPDVVEAMASSRPYRPSRGLPRALQEISQNRGTVYDPEVVDVCLHLFESGFGFH